MKRNRSDLLRAIMALILSLTIACTWSVPSVFADEPADHGASESSDAVYKDGTFEGTGAGRNGPINVSVTIQDGAITGIEILSQDETEEYWEQLYDVSGNNIITSGIIASQSPDVDAVSGATLSSDGIKDAVRDALMKASTSVTGSGTAKDPYVIRDAAQLAYFGARVDAGDADFTSAYVVLGADIDLSGVSFDPIGAEGKASSNKAKLFRGTFNGRGRTISGMTIGGSYDAEANLGLFSTLGGEARISNVVLEDVDINVESTGDFTPVRAGGIAGDTQTLSPRGTIIDGCSVSGTITLQAATSSAWGGGILGRSMGGAAVINCISSVFTSVSSQGSGNAAYAGGIVGSTGNNNTLANCASFAASEAENTSGSADAYAGGIAGMLSAKMYNCYASGNVTITQKAGTEKQFAGALAGQLAASPDGSFNYYSSDAKITIADDGGSGQTVEPRPWSTDDVTGSATAEEPVTAAYMASEDFCTALNSNLNTVSQALADQDLDLCEWTLADGKVVLSDTVWVPGEVDSGIFAGGTGSKEDPYIIENADQLRAFASSLSSKIDYTGMYIRLGQDIDLAGENFSPIGGSFYRFNGDFDGNGHKITGLSEGSASEPLELTGENSYIGLFGWINEKAHIHDLTLENVAIYTHSTGSAYVGGIAGRMNGTETEGDYRGAVIDSCRVTGVIRHTTDRGTSFMGGVVGHMFKGAVINTMSDVEMTGKELSGELAEVGGIVGLLNRGVIANSYALGNLTGSGYRDTQYDIEGMACVGNIAAVNGGSIVNCYGQGDVEALEYSIDAGVIAGWVTGIAKVYNCWYNEDAHLVIDGRSVDPVDPFGETVAGGVSDEWGFTFPGSLTDNINGYHPADDADKVAAGLNSSFESFPIDLEGTYGLPADALRTWTAQGGQVVLSDTRAAITYVQPEIEKQTQEAPEQKLIDGTWQGRSSDKTSLVAIKVSGGEVVSTEVLAGSGSGDAYDEAVNRAKLKAKFGDNSTYDQPDLAKFGGSGTAQDPYRIENEEQLRYLASSLNEDVDWEGVYFRQTGNIEVSGEEWKPIGWGIFADADGDGFGQDVVALYPFCGIYDGAGYSVKGLRAGTKDKPAAVNYMGLFGIIQGSYEGNEIPEGGYRTEIKNVHIEDAAFYTENKWRSYIGGLVGNAQGGFSIDNCSAAGRIVSRSTEDFAFAGGLAGSLMYGSVTDSWTDVDATSWSGMNYSYAAGMAATTNRATIVNSYTEGNVHADADQTNRAEAGGFTALDGGICINCFAKGDVEAVSKYSMYVGGFTGMAASSAEHRQCYYNTSASQKAGGKEVSEKRFAGKFVNESAEANAQAKSGDEMASQAFADLLESNRQNISATLSQVKAVLGADANGSSKYHSVYYNGDGSDLNKWILINGEVKQTENSGAGEPAGTVTAPAAAASAEISTVTVNTKVVNAKAVTAAIQAAGAAPENITTIVLGKKVKRIRKGAFKNFGSVTSIEIRSKKLKKSTVKGSLRGSAVKRITVKVGKAKKNKKFAKKYKKLFTRKNAGKKVKVRAAA